MINQAVARPDEAADIAAWQTVGSMEAIEKAAFISATYNVPYTASNPSR
jgi:hypothetical protein